MTRLDRVAHLACVLLVAAGAAHAEPRLSPPPGARLPLDLALADEQGRRVTLGTAFGGLPVIFAFADFGCQVLCGTSIGMAAALLPETGLRPGADYRLVVVGLDPHATPRQAREMRRAWLGDAGPLAADSRFLIGDAEAVGHAAAALGYRAERRENGFDHPLALLALAADGRLVAILPGLGATPEALAAAIRRAADAPVPGILARVALLCRSAARGGRMQRILALGGVATLALMGVGAALLLRRGGPP